ncbi:hypothetical protein CP557_02105 [Natrinema ejinorense]|uniref:Uncharacterized protein n=2 Tax=Natrinema ejinorense TaxID=373386 RepID=A0A2A5QRP2_9EURY|nr:hypothetical protein CP557_02105 [Natrinema ejinorense]
MPIIALVVSFGLVLGMFGALGVTDMFNGPQTQVEDEVASTAEEQNESQIDPNEAGEGGFISFTVSAVREVAGILHLVVFLPSTLASIGFPWPFARAAGHGAQIVIGVTLANAWLGDAIR